MLIAIAVGSRFDRGVTDGMKIQSRFVRHYSRQDAAAARFARAYLARWPSARHVPEKTQAWVTNLRAAAARDYPEGVLDGVDDRSVADMMGYRGYRRQEVIGWAVEAGVIEGPEGARRLVDWDRYFGGKTKASEKVGTKSVPSPYQVGTIFSDRSESNQTLPPPPAPRTEQKRTDLHPPLQTDRHGLPPIGDLEAIEDELTALSDCPVGGDVFDVEGKGPAGMDPIEEVRAAFSWGHTNPAQRMRIQKALKQAGRPTAEKLIDAVRQHDLSGVRNPWGWLVRGLEQGYLWNVVSTTAPPKGTKPPAGGDSCPPPPPDRSEPGVGQRTGLVGEGGATPITIPPETELTPEDVRSLDQKPCFAKAGSLQESLNEVGLYLRSDHGLQAVQSPRGWSLAKLRQGPYRCPDQHRPGASQPPPPPPVYEPQSAEERERSLDAMRRARADIEGLLGPPAAPTPPPQPDPEPQLTEADLRAGDKIRETYEHLIRGGMAPERALVEAALAQ